MHSRVGPHLDNVWKRVRKSRNWPYLALLVFIILPLLWIAYSLAVRASMFGFSNAPSSNAPSSDQVKLFLTFIGGGLATAVTMFAALFTREHNIRERRRLRLETVLKSLDSLPAETSPRMAGVLSTMVLLGQQRIAIRVLEPAWENGSVDPGTATWLIGQVLTGASSYGDPLDGDRTDMAAINEAAVLLVNHANQLTDEHMYYFPGYFLERWRTEKELPTSAKNYLLIAMGRMLTSRDKDWWSPGGGPPVWPTKVLVKCAENESVRSIRLSAAVLLAALHDCFPKEFEDSLRSDRMETILKQADEAVATHSVPREYLSLANKIRSDWGTS
jgi:hypothetical protein